MEVTNSPSPKGGQSQEEIASTLLSFQESQKRVNLVVNCDGKLDNFQGKVLVAGNTKSKFFRDNLPGNRTAAIFISRSDIIQVSAIPVHGSPLYEAVKENRFDEVAQILRLTMNENINETNEHFGWSSLHWASFNGNVLIVLELISHPQININIFANDLATPLHLACKHGHESVVSALLAHPSTVVDVADKFEETPLYKACEKGHITIVEMMIQAGADVRRTNRQSKTPLQAACENGFEKVGLLLVRDLQAPPSTLSHEGLFV